MDHKVNLNKILAEGFKPDAKRKKRLKTGFDALDQNLGGGLSPGLIILGGIPGVGKSTFALQLAEYVAETGTPVLYFSLEMPGERILAKAISRNLYKKNREQPSLCLSAEELMGGDGTDPLTSEQWEQVGIIKRSLELGLENFYLWTDAVSASVIVKRVQDAAKNQKPLVIIDYLQILPPEESRAQTEKQIVDKTLKLFMSQLAHGEDGVPVILISSLNRSSYGAIQINAFKETGGIEYSADVLLGLQSGSQTGDSREVELSILKNRYGPSGNKLKFLYHSRYDYFEAFPSHEAEAVSPKTEQASAASETAESAVPAQTKKKAKKDKPAEKYFDSYINNTLVANEIRKGEGVDKKRSCNVFGKVHTTYRLSEPLFSLDCCVADAIYTIYKGAEDPQSRQAPAELSFSLSKILLVLTGNRQRTLTASKAAELEHSIDHLMETKLYLDCTEELWERAKQEQKKMNGPSKIPEKEEWVYDNGPFLVLRKYLRDQKTGQEQQVEPGQTKPGHEVFYRFFSQDAERGILPLYTYGERTGEMIRFSSVLLNVTKTEDGASRLLSNTAENICLKRFLIRRLKVLSYEDETEHKKRRRTSRDLLQKISFYPGSNLMTELRLPPQKNQLSEAAQEMRLKRLHDTTETILAYYKKINYISDFKRVKQPELLGRKSVPATFQIEMKPKNGSK